MQMSAPIGTWEYDLATGRLAWSDAVYDLFDLPRGSVLDRAMTVDLYELESRIVMERLRGEAIRRLGCFTLDARIRTAAGNQRWMRLTADVSHIGTRPVRLFGTKQDVTADHA